jgi:hypothetical protein
MLRCAQKSAQTYPTGVTRTLRVRGASPHTVRGHADKAFGMASRDTPFALAKDLTNESAFPST